ncbi:hypothetical protein TrVE_jg8418 [Triparma verrucosa]|uniref:Uncharacterized protein n=1 Tax=Triparma verrucosa TaxID=1606542 RepID=A0A9W7CCP1_9STRA|nr:hypothetical protein TrVE_jg8418 [Triparma verrucosa]
MISYDWDASPEQRRKVPFYYGYIPDKALSRARWLLYYIAADMGLFFLYKIVRRDFFYYANLKGLIRLVLSIPERFTIKLMADFTMLIHLRGPTEMGGFWFLQVKMLMGGEEEK